MASAQSVQQKMNIVIVGHVDHGKSTVIGRLMADTHSLPQGKLERVQAACAVNAKPFEYAFLLDALKDEQAQGITIDTARVFFKSSKREYIIIDAPGHIEFLKNMISGAARAEAALLVIDAQEGIQENSKRHGYLLSMLGIRQVAVCVNKMDLVDYKQAVFKKIETDFKVFLKEIGLQAEIFIPLSAREGENVIKSSKKMAWFKGPSVLGVLDAFKKAPSVIRKPLRMPVQAVYKFTKDKDDRRIVAGRVESGKLKTGDEVIFLPSNKRSQIQSIEAFNGPKPKSVSAGCSAGVTLTEQIYIHRGEILCKAAEPLPKVSSLFRAELFWMGKRGMKPDQNYKLKIASASVPVKLKKIERVMDASNLKKLKVKAVGRHDVAQVVLETTLPIAFDLTGELEATGRFVIVDQYDIAGGGIITEAIEDTQAEVREQVAQREQNWDFSVVDPEERSARYGHYPRLVLLTGKEGLDKRGIAKQLEKALFELGVKSYFLGHGNLLRGLSTDVQSQKLKRADQVRQMGEVAHLFMDAGLLVVATASNMNDEELFRLQEIVSRDLLKVVNVGANPFRDGLVDLQLDPKGTAGQNSKKILKLLEAEEILFTNPAE